jgi:hypothetical protein
MATKEFLRKLRMKHHLGEFSNKAKKQGPKRVFALKVKRKRKTGVFHMKHKKHYGKSGGIMSLVRMAYNSAMTGIGSAAVANKLTNNTEVVPYQAELAAFGGSAVTGRSVKNALIKGAIGAGAVMAVKYLPGLVSGNVANSNSGVVLH